MNRKVYSSFLTVIVSVFMATNSFFLTGCSSSSSTPPPPPVESIAATSGTPQSAAVGAAFAAPLVATVTTGGSPMSGVTVTFTVPATGATGSFAGGVNTATTNASGVATSAVFTAGTTDGAYTVTASVSGVSTTANFSLTNTAGAAASIAATGGSGQSAVVGAAFASALVATVVDSGSNPVSGATVTFTAPVSGASGIFATTPPSSTASVTTDANGLATSPALTAATMAGTYTVAATVAGVSTAADFSLTNTAPPPIAVTFGPRASALQPSGGSGFTAFVTNDSANAGVTWTVTCGSAGACGSFAATSTASGVAADFSAPAAIPSGNTVTITATSVTDSTKKATAVLTIANTTLTDGNYVFTLTGTNANTSSPFYVGGAFVVVGGSITSGEQDYVDLVNYETDSITSGSVTGTGGNLQIVLNTPDANVGVNGVETLVATFISSTRARLIEFDSTLTSSGRMDMQTSTAAPSAGYAFFTAGLDSASLPTSIGGVINIDGSGTISGAGSVFDINDGSLPAPLQAQSFDASTVSPPDSFGRVVFSLVPSSASGVLPVTLAGYIVDTTHIRLVEEEPSSSSFLGTMAGLAIGQGTHTGTFSSIAGNSYVTGMNGFDTSAFGMLQAAGLFTANSDGSVSGAINYNDLSGSGPATPSPITGGTYTVDPTGRVTLTGVTDGTATFNLQLYLTGNGQEGESIAVSMDPTDILSGLSWQQTGSGSYTAASFFGGYTMSMNGFDPSGNELDAIGPVVSDGTSVLTGTVDLNSFSVGENTGLPVSGMFTANPNGAFAGTITGLDVTNGGSQQDAYSYYVADSTKIFVIETDANQLTLGFFALEQ
jgi:hypothetical protein